MTVTINGTTGLDTPAITNNGAYVGDGISFADNAPSNSLVVNSSGNVGIGTSSPTEILTLGTVSTAARQIRINGNVNPAFIGATSAVANFAVNRRTSDGSIINTGYSAAYITLDGSSGGSTIYFNTAAANNTQPSERMRIDSSGRLLVGTTSVISGSGAIIQGQGAAGTPAFAFNRSNAGGIGYFYYANTASPVGSIDITSTSTAYVTSSDYRLKENIQPMQNALATVAQLNPVTYTWKADGSDGQGFIAHELQSVVPDCVTGEKDAVDAEGKPVYQGIDTSFLVATLCKAIQELEAELDATKAEVAALKEAK